MPYRKEHQIAGGSAGLLLAGIWSANNIGSAHPAILAGGVLGGLLGASIPDTLDPPNSPNHRGAGHSVAMASMISGVCATTLSELISYAREEYRKVNAYVNQGYQPPLLAGLRLHALLLAIGIMVGIPAGLVSHLVLDSGTPDGIRVLNRHF
jgi:membrane-bound metal-dependent hydrolase YbcI (DUF457 family)